MKRPSGATVRGVVVLISRKQLVWYEIPTDPTREWKRHEIGAFPAAAGQSGMAIGDVAGHGRADIVCGMFWAEYPADPTGSWRLHRFGNWDDNRWGGMAKLAVADLDGDGNKLIADSTARTASSSPTSTRTNGPISSRAR